MGKIIRHEFLGSRALVVFLCITVIGIPIAVIYLIEGFVTVEEEVPDPTAFLEAYRRKNA
jgi:hypothetical protein